MPIDIPAAVTAPSFDTYLRSLMNWPLIVGESMLVAQRQQWEMLSAWQRSFDAAQRECVDQWICRWGGGVPLDG